MGLFFHFTFKSIVYYFILSFWIYTCFPLHSWFAFGVSSSHCPPTKIQTACSFDLSGPRNYICPRNKQTNKKERKKDLSLNYLYCITNYHKILYFTLWLYCLHVFYLFSSVSTYKFPTNCWHCTIGWQHKTINLQKRYNHGPKCE